MKEAEILSHLEKIISQLQIELRYEKGDFRGGVCRVGEKQIFFINTKLMPSQKMNLMIQELSQFNLSGIYIVPAIRVLLENAAKEQEKMEV